jgi:hypothetical protein
MSTLAMKLRSRRRQHFILRDEPTLEVSPQDAPDPPPDLTPTELVADVTGFLVLEDVDLFDTVRAGPALKENPIEY